MYYVHTHQFSFNMKKPYAFWKNLSSKNCLQICLFEFLLNLFKKQKTCTNFVSLEEEIFNFIIKILHFLHYWVNLYKIGSLDIIKMYWFVLKYRKKSNKFYAILNNSYYGKYLKIATITVLCSLFWGCT